MKKVFNLIIVDESGSMSIIQHQALMGLNETLETIQKMQDLYKDKSQIVSLLTFSTTHCGFIFENEPVENTHTLSKGEYQPRGGTPLYDAIGLGISKTNAAVEEGDEVIVTIITDGEENSSVEFNLKMIKNLIDKLKAQKWIFALIGTDNLDVEGMGRNMSINNRMSFQQTDEGTKKMFAEERASRINFNDCLNQDMEINRDDYFNKKKKD
jgi:Mg-chelatase subunit ChlD